MVKDLLTRAAVWTARRVPPEVIWALKQGSSRAADSPPGDLEQRVSNLEQRAYLYDTLFYKAFVNAGLGDYLEFGVYTGGSLCAAYRAAYEFYRQLSLDAVWGDLAGQVATGRHQWDALRFIGFDSFQGIPAITGPDAERPNFVEGEWAATQNQVWNTIDQSGVDRHKIHLVEGFFEESCNPETAERLGLTEIAVVHVDSDIYESARTALNFCTPYFREGSVVIFDEWFQYQGSPDYGEQRAFREWCAQNPDWHVAELAREAVGRMAFILNRRS